MTALPETFWLHVEKTDTCWIWTGAVQSSGYGSVGIGNRRTALAHRLSYEAHAGPIPDGYTIDHVVTRGCTDKRCVRPDHLEPVTHAENNRRARAARGYFVGGQCGKGHALVGDNVYTRKGGAACATCRRTTHALHQRRTRAAAYPAGEPTPEEMRAWAAANGYHIGIRGRIKREIRNAFLEAHRDQFPAAYAEAVDRLAYGDELDTLAHSASG